MCSTTSRRRNYFLNQTAWIPQISHSSIKDGRGKRLLTKKGVEVVVDEIETIRVLKKKHTETVIEETRVHKESDEEDLDHSKNPLFGFDDEIEDISSDDEKTDVDDSKKADEEKDGEEQAMDEQAEIEQPRKVQSDVPELQVEKPLVQIHYSKLTLSSAKYNNQSINDNLDVSLTDVLKEPVEAEDQSLVDVLVHQENPAVQRTLLVDRTVTMIPRLTAHSPLQQPPKQSKTKILLKKSKEKVDADVVLQRLIKLEKKVDRISKIDHFKTMNKFFQSHLKKLLPTAAPDFGKLKHEKAARQSIPKYSTTSFDEALLKEYDLKYKLISFMSIKKRKRKDSDASPSKKSKDKEASSKEGKAPSKSSKTDKVVDAEETVQDDAMDAEELIDDEPETPDREWCKEPNADDAPEHNWFNEMVNAKKYPVTFYDLMGSIVDFTQFAKICLKKDKLTKADLEGPAFKLLKGNYKNHIKLEYNMEQCYLALKDQINWAKP
ncbi:hypothetical protein Tco_0097591 [Tanacetum coccineum]